MQKFKVNACHWRRQTMTYHPVLGWWFVPNLRARIPMDGGFYTLKTNSLGMRADLEYPIHPPAGRKRLVVLGDSYTAADGVDNSQRYTDRLEQKYPHLDVLNFGCPNTGTDQQVLIYEHLARPFEADAIILALVVENIGRNLQTCRPAGDPHEVILGKISIYAGTMLARWLTAMIPPSWTTPCGNRYLMTSFVIGNRLAPELGRL